MKQLALVTAALTAVMVLAPPPVLAAPNPILIQQCFVTVPKALSKKASGTQIVYVNRDRRKAVSITFEVAYRNSEHNFLRSVADTGMFSPGEQIDHHFALYNDVTFGGKETRGCRATSITWSDGSRTRP